MLRVGVIDFFCGCGGTSSGFIQANTDGVEYTILAGIDFDPYCCATFSRNIGAPALQLDIRALADSPEAIDELAARFELSSFDRVLLIGCAPCQGFAAHRKYVAGEDPRRTLFGSFCRIVDHLRPDAVMVENVPDMFSKAHWPYFEAGREILQNSGYTVRSRIYNFASFGLPQERFRAVVLAMRGGFDMPEPLLSPDEFRTVRQAISHLPALNPGEASPLDPMHVTSKHRQETVAVLARVPKDGGNRPVGVGPACLDRTRAKHGGFTDVYGRLAWDRPAVTMTARCRTPSCGRFAHPEQDRGLSVREAALLQGFPDGFLFEGPFDDKFKQVGNAVPPVAAKAIAEHLSKELLSGPRDFAQVPDDIEKPVGPGFAVTINGIKRKRSGKEGPQIV